MAFPPSSTPRRALSVGTVVVVLALAVSGCSGDAKDGDVVGTGSPSTSQSADSASAVPSATEADGYVPATKEHPARNVPKPVMPAEAHKETDAGARAFMRYWVDSLNYSIDTGDGTLVSPLMTKENKQFSTVIEQYHDVYSNGGWSMGTRQNMELAPQKLEKDDKGFWRFFVYLERTDGTVIRASGQAENVQGGGDMKNPLEAYLVYEEGGWLLHGFQADK